MTEEHTKERAETASNMNTDMIGGGIFRSIFWFSVPLLIGNFFQQLYNTVDSYVVGNYVSTSALAAVGASSPVINMLVGFFMGLSAGAGVVISQYFGARKGHELSRAVHASMALTALLSVIFTVLGLVFTGPLLKAIGVPEDVLPHSSLYLMIYFTGIAFSLFYNMGAGVLRAVGDSTHPLIYLAAACMVNVVLDFLFVCGFHMGIAGAAIATVIAQGVSCVMVMGKLMRAKTDYRVELKRIRLHKKMIRRIISFGFPAALQQSVTSFSNVVVQSYINHFGTAAMAGYSATIRIDGFTQLPLQSFNMAITTFVGQNIGAKQYDRVKKGVFAAWLMSSGVIAVCSVCIFSAAPFLIGIFTKDAEVIAIGSGMERIFSAFYLALPVVQILNGALRGAGLSKIPMYFMLGSFVVLRQIYLMIAVPLTNDVNVVMAGWPITWIICAIGMAVYYFKTDWLKKYEV